MPFPFSVNSTVMRIGGNSAPGAAGSDALDAMGCYPIFACPRWDALPGDVREPYATRHDGARRIVAHLLTGDSPGGKAASPASSVASPSRLRRPLYAMPDFIAAALA